MNTKPYGSWLTLRPKDLERFQNDFRKEANMVKQPYVAQAIADCKCTMTLTDTKAEMNWCPVHAVAPLLLKALQLCHREMRGMHSHYHPTCEGGCPFAEADERARLAIMYATGEVELKPEAVSA